MADIGLYKPARKDIKDHDDTLSVVLVFISFGMFIVMAALNGLAASGIAVPEIFHSTVANISAKYELQITPAGYTFAIWGIIYTWLFFSLIGLIVTLFLTNQNGKLYLNPPFITPLMMATMSFNFLCNTIWIFLWDRELMVEAAALLLLLLLNNMSVVAMMAKSIFIHRSEYAWARPMFLWGTIYRVMMNGFGVYTTWTVIATLINVTIALVYKGEMDMTTTCMASLSLLVLAHSVWFVLENTVLDKYVRFLLTPYLVVIWAVNGIRVAIQEKGDIPAKLESFVVIILVVAVITLVVRVVLVLYKCLRGERNEKSAYTSY